MSLPTMRVLELSGAMKRTLESIARDESPSHHYAGALVRRTLIEPNGDGGYLLTRKGELVLEVVTIEDAEWGRAYGEAALATDREEMLELRLRLDRLESGLRELGGVVAS